MHKLGNDTRRRCAHCDVAGVPRVQIWRHVQRQRPRSRCAFTHCGRLCCWDRNTRPDTFVDPTSDTHRQAAGSACPAELADTTCCHPAPPLHPLPPLQHPPLRPAHCQRPGCWWSLGSGGRGKPCTVGTQTPPARSTAQGMAMDHRLVIVVNGLWFKPIPCACAVCRRCPLGKCPWCFVGLLLPGKHGRSVTAALCCQTRVSFVRSIWFAERGIHCKHGTSAATTATHVTSWPYLCIKACMDCPHGT